MTPLTQEQKIVLTGYTGILCCDSFAEFHEDVERRLNRPVFTHEFASESFQKAIEELYKEDFFFLIGYSTQEVQ